MNYSYLLQSLKIPKDAITIVNPFYRDGSIGNCIDPHITYIVENYDIQPKTTWTKQQDTLSFPPNYENKYIFTHVPSKELNEFRDGSLYDIYNLSHKYKCFLKNLISNQCAGGIVIVPADFWVSMNMSDIVLRNEFQKVYKIIRVNIFRDVKDEHLHSSLSSFQFEKRNGKQKRKDFVPLILYPKQHHRMTTSPIQTNEN